MNIYRSPTPLLCFQMEQVKQDLSRRDSELLGLQTKLETLTNQFSDSKQHIEVLKESLTAKEQRAAILQTEVQHNTFAQRILEYVYSKHPGAVLCYSFLCMVLNLKTEHS